MSIQIGRKKNLAAICLSLLFTSAASAGSMSVSCADAYGEYFLEGNQVFGRTSEAYFPVEIVQKVLISSETAKCTTKSGKVLESYREMSVVRVLGQVNDQDQKTEIAFLCEGLGDNFSNTAQLDMDCVTKETTRQGPFTER